MDLESGKYKKEVFEELLQRGTVKVRVLSHPDVSIAPTVKLPCILDYGLNLPVPMTDLSVTDQGISATLSFGRTPFKTFVPWDAADSIFLENQSFFIGWGKELAELKNLSNQLMGGEEKKEPEKKVERPKFRLV